MYEHVEKPKENKSRAVANSVSQKKSNVKQGFGFVDNRTESTSRKVKTKGMLQPLQRYWDLNQYGQYFENGKEPIGKFYAVPTKQWLSMSKGEATNANLAIALKDAMESDPGGHIGNSNTIEELTETYSQKPKQTVIDDKGLWMACWKLASETLKCIPITTFNSKQTIAKAKTFQKGGGVSYATIDASGWVIESGVRRLAKIKSIGVDQITITAHLMDDGTFRFTIGLIHWSIRD